MSPAVVFGLPLYDAAEHLPEALESLLGQTEPDIAVVCVDDGSDPAVEAIVRRYADPRVHYERNPERLGMAANWRRAFARALELHPGAERFAWASDHDVWHPRWAAALGAALDARPDAAMAYARDAVLGERGVLRRRRASIDTSEIAGRRALLWRLAREMRAGQMVYGLFRVPALREAGVFRDVLFPDRLLLTEVALRGHLVEVPEVLWYKRKTGDFGVERQRAALFAGAPPRSARAPWWLVHARCIAREHGPAAGAWFAAANASSVAQRRLR